MSLSPIHRPSQSLQLFDLLDSLTSSNEIPGCHPNLLLKSGALNTRKSTQSSKTSRSKYSNNSKLLRSSLFQVLKAGQRGKQGLKQDEKMSLELLRETLGLLDRERQQWLCRFKRQVQEKCYQSEIVIKRLQGGLK